MCFIVIAFLWFHVTLTYPARMFSMCQDPSIWYKTCKGIAVWFKIPQKYNMACKNHVKCTSHDMQLYQIWIRKTQTRWTGQWPCYVWWVCTIIHQALAWDVEAPRLFQNPFYSQTSSRSVVNVLDSSIKIFPMKALIVF